MNEANDSARRPIPGWVPMILLTGLAFWLRARGLPGSWGSDSLTYFDACRADDPASADPRADRWLAVALVRGALRLGDWSPAAASLPGVLLSAAVVPALWLGLRRRLGELLALLPCALWTFLGLAIEETVEISTDVMAVLPCAFAVGALAGAWRDAERRRALLVTAGIALGVAATMKETALFALAGFAAGAFCLGTGAARWRNAATLAVPALLLFGAGVVAASPHRVQNASEYMAVDPAFIPPTPQAFLRRITIEMPAALLTATQAYGLLFVVTLPLLVRLPFRALRSDALAAATLGGFAAFDVLPISLRTWSLLPASRPRYVLCMMPVLLAALTDALRERPAGRAERWTSLGAAALALAFVGTSPWTMILVPPGVLLAAWPALPEAIRATLPDRTRLGAAAGVLVAATVAWAHLPAGPTPLEWTVAGAAGVLVTTPWLVGRDREGPLPYFAAGAAIVLAVAMTRSRFVPDEGWNAWRSLPPAGRVYAETIVGRRLRAAAPAAGADAGRVVLLGPYAAPPAGLAADDRVLAVDLGPLGAGLRLADACRAPGSGLAQVPAELGEAVLFAPAPR